MSRILPTLPHKHNPQPANRFSHWMRGLLLGTIAMATVPSASAAPQDGQQFNAWTVRCAKPTEDATQEVCFLVQVANDPSSNEPLVAVEIGYVPGEKQPLAQFTLPLGVLLPPGMQIAVDQSEQAGRVPFTYCDRVGCRAMLRLDEKVLGMFKKGNTLNVTIANLQGQTAKVPVSLSGFTAGFNALK